MECNLRRFYPSESRFGTLKERIFLGIFLTLPLAWWAGCGAKRDYTAATVPGWDIVQTMALEPPPDLSSGQQRDFEEGWRNVQQGKLEAAASDLDGLSRRYGRSPEIVTARAFLELRLGSVPSAERYFQTALRERPTYGPAQGGYVLAALAAGNDELAYDRLARLERDYPQHPLVDRYQTTLQINVAESRVANARELNREGRFADAAAAYLKALEAAPEVGALYLEAAEVELAAGLTARAVLHADRATELDSTNASAYRILGEAHYAREELTGAYEAYRTAAELSPRDVEIQKRLELIEREYQEEHLPPAYLEIRDAERVTRAEIAALFYLELRSAFDFVPEGPSVIATDIGTNWAATFIRHVLGVGILEVYANHTFQPQGFVRRLELSEALARALERLAPEAYRQALDSSGLEHNFPDLAASNPRFEAAALAVSLGLLMVGEGGDFEPQGFVSGEEAVSAVAALAAHLTP